MAKQFIGAVLGNELIAKDIYKFKVESKELAINAMPGQFVNVKCCDGIESLLRRPISLLDVNQSEGTFEFAFQIKGTGTKYLANKKKGDTLDIIGPLGKPFIINNSYKKIALIGGGIGTFPLYLLAKNLKETNRDLNIDTFLGFRSKPYIMMEKEFSKYSANVFVGTDDGSYGFNGYIVDYLHQKVMNDRYDIIYSCGPNPMLKAVAKTAESHNIKCQISLEQRMGCGIGACLVCACKVKAKDGWDYKHVCKDGPVFWSEEVIFDE